MNYAAYAEKEAQKQDRLAATIQRDINATIEEMKSIPADELDEYRVYLNGLYARRDNAIDAAKEYRDPAYAQRLHQDDDDQRQYMSQY